MTQFRRVSLIGTLTLGVVGYLLVTSSIAVGRFFGVLMLMGAFVAAPVTALLTWALSLARKKTAEFFENALLTPAVVISSQPLEFVSLANMNTGLGRDRHAIKRVKIDVLPEYSSDVGTQFPCVSTFDSGEVPGIWGDFDPVPLSFGTGEPDILKSRAEKIGAEGFAVLRACVKKGVIPDEAGKLIFLDPPDA